MKLSVIIPVFNEVSIISEIIHRVMTTGIVHEVIVVDDGSTDGTVDILRALSSWEKFLLVEHGKNCGNSCAIRTGLKAVSGDVILIQDADLEYDPREYQNLLKPLEENICDIVYGSRFLGGARRPILFWSMVANKILTLTTNILYNNIISDMETGYKVFRKSVLEWLELHANGFNFEPEFTAKILKKKKRIYEVPISFNPRDYSDGKNKKIDAFQAMWTLNKYRFVN